MLKKVLTLEQFSEEAGIHRSTAIRLIKAGLVKFSRTKPKTGHIRIRREWVNQYLNASTSGGQAYGK